MIALHGLVDINMASRIDSRKGGIRSSFESIPDAPVSRFILESQNGRVERSGPAVRAGGCPKQRGHRRHRGG